MTADVFDSILGLIQQGTGNNNNTWGTTFNTSFAALAVRAIAGVNIISTTGGTTDYSGSPPPAGPRQDIDYIQIVEGALTSDATFKVPNLSKSWLIANRTTGSFNLYMQTPSGNPTQIPQGTTKLVWCDGNNVCARADEDEVGSFRLSGKAAIGPGELACNGASLLKTEYPDLSNAIGTTWGSADALHFTLPNFTDTGRFLRSGSGSVAVGTYQSNQFAAHTHTITGALTAGSLGTDVQGAHVHGVIDPGHDHSFQLIANIGNFPLPAAGSATGSGEPLTNTSQTGIALQSAGSHNHNITGAPSLGSVANASAGTGTETRPETAVVLMAIRY